MDALYAAAYPQLYADHWWWRAREDMLLRKIRRLLSNVPDARILDVGCGAAMFFDALEPFGHVEGVESDRAAAERSGRWRGRIVVGDLDETYAPTAPFDLILMLDVLEHIDHPERVLARARQILRPNGRVLITVPACMWLWTSHDEINHHVTRYSTGALRDIVTDSGLVALETGYLFQSLVVPKLLVRVKESLFQERPRLPTIPPPAINSLIQAWCRLEHRVAGRLPFGGSAFAVAARADATPEIAPPTGS
jgi:SAM-dependent methyltransferase